MSSQFSRGLAVISGLIGVACPIYLTGASDATAGEKPAAAQMDSLLAPIALFPDELLAKVLRASTYPLEVNKAAEWVAQNSRLHGPALDAALQKQHWDVSIDELVWVPVIMVKMNDELVWTGQLGEAFLSNPQDVLERIQQLRLRAKNHGFLLSTAEQTVFTRSGKIIIGPSVAHSLHVPYYDAGYIYGALGEQHWTSPPPGRTYRKGIAFLDGIALPRSFASDRIDWRNGNLYVASASNDAVVRTELWHHDPVHRRGVIYSSRQLQDRFAPDAHLRTTDRGNEARSLVGLSPRGGGLAGIGKGKEIRDLSQRGRSSLHRSRYQDQGKLTVQGAAI